MADAGTLTIRVEADTRDFEKGMERTRAKMSKAEKQAIKMRKNQAKWETAAGTATVAGVGARTYQRYSSGRGRSSLLGGAAKLAMKSALMAAIPGLGALMVGGWAMGKVFGGGKGGNRQRRSETDTLLQGIFDNTKLQATTLTQIESLNRAAMDPLRRGARYQQERIAQRGIGITELQLAAQAELQRSKMERQEASSAFWRNLKGFVAPISTMVNDARGMVSEALANLTSTREGGPVPGPRYRFDQPGVPVNWEASPAYQAAVAEAERKLLMRQQLFMLNVRGPANIIGAPPTAQAGSDAEYALRVQMQRRGLQDNITREWQRRVVALLEQMAQDNPDMQEDVWRFQAQSGMIQVEGVE